MTLTKVIAGNLAKPSEANANWASSLRAAGLNTVRQLIDRDIDFSAGTTDCFADAYVDADGRENTVNTGSTVAFADLLNLKRVPTCTLTAQLDTLHTTSSSGSWTNTSNAFNFNLSDAATVSAGASAIRTHTFGTTFSAKTITRVYYSVQFQSSSGSNNYLYLQTYDGSTWNTVLTIKPQNTTGGDILFQGTYDVNSSVQGVRLSFQIYYNSTLTQSVYVLQYGQGNTSEEIVHTIPSGRLPATISSSCLVPFIADWETGADIQYKLTNGSSDTGWLSCGTTTPISNFAAFSTEPTTLTIKLIPKSSSPTAGFPSIRGFTLFAE